MHKKRINYTIITRLLHAIAGLLLISCGTTIKKFKKKNFSINKKQKYIVVIDLGGAATTTSGAKVGNFSGNVSSFNSAQEFSAKLGTIGVTHKMSGETHVLIAAKDIEAEMRTMGIDVTNNPKESEVVALFSIGTVRYDPLAGWIADRSSLELRSKKNNETLLLLRSINQLITPTISTHVDNIVYELKKVVKESN